MREAVSYVIGWNWCQVKTKHALSCDAHTSPHTCQITALKVGRHPETCESDMLRKADPNIHFYLKRTTSALNAVLDNLSPLSNRMKKILSHTHTHKNTPSTRSLNAMLNLHEHNSFKWTKTKQNRLVCPPTISSALVEIKLHITEVFV